MKMTDTELERVRALDGKHCENCLKLVAIDRYGITPTMVTVLRKMAKTTHEQMAPNKSGRTREIDIEDIELKHSERTQLTKMRFHGLITKVLNPDGSHKARHWLVTTKGYNFLGGSLVDAKVEVYNNTVIGHVGGQTDIHEVEKADKLANDPAVLDREYIAPAEARALSHTREPRHKTTVHAAWQRRSFGNVLVEGAIYELELNGLTFGKPVEVLTINGKPTENMQYKDISAFRRDWKITQ